jgi:hypothetical protein
VTRPSTRPFVRRSAAAVGLAALLLGVAPAAGMDGAGVEAAGVEAAGVSAAEVRTTDEPGEEPDEESEEAPEPAVPADPLAMVIDRVTPAVMPQRGRLVVTGSILNRSETEWTELSVYLLTSTEPITDAAALEEAAASDPRTDVGDRLVDPGLYVDVSDLMPGESTRFRLSVPRSELLVSGAPGVYWLGVHVLGASDGARLEGADGRARTFLPLVPRRTLGTRLALGLQLRRHTVRSPDGRLVGAEQWADDLAPSGRLDRLVRLSRSAGSWPLTLVVDPALVDAARSVARGNPALGLDGAGPAGGSAREDGAAGGTGSGAGDAPGEEAEEPSASTRAAQRWIETFAQEADRRPVLAVPYADLDVSAVLRYGARELFTRAATISRDLLATLDVESSPVVLAPGGYLAPTALEEVDDATPVVLGTGAVEGATPGSVLERPGGGRVLVAPDAATVRGPGPTGVLSALGVRQRLLADAALHVLSDDSDEPLVRLLPGAWDPGPGWRRARLFASLDQPWLSGTTVTGVLGSPATATLEEVAYPEAAEDAEVPVGTVRAAEELVDGGVVLEELLTRNEVVDDLVTRQALTAPSVWSRARPRLAAARARDALGRVEGWLDDVSVRSPAFVTMSSESGTFTVTLVNDLDQPVTVGLRATVTGGRLELQAPDPVELLPNGRGAMRIDATAGDIGVHEVTLQPVTDVGTPVGQETTLSIRSSRVGLILWVVMAAGSGVLLVAIVLRVRKRIRQRRRTHGPLLKRADG